MVLFDIIVGALLVYGLIRGIWNGFFAELASLVSLLLGIWIAIKFSHFTAAVLSKQVSWDPQNIKVAAFIITFVLVVVGVTLLAKFFTTVASFAGLGIFNKIMGGVLGMLKMALVVSIFVNFVGRLNSEEALFTRESAGKSIFYNPLKELSAEIFPAIAEMFPDLKGTRLTA